MNRRIPLISMLIERCTGTARLSGLIMVAGMLLCLPRLSHAGPPLVIDDPGILEPGKWEVIAAVAGEDRAGGKITQAPLLDISLGLTSNTQLSFFLPHDFVEPKDEASVSGLAHASVGFKWRFVSTDKWEWAIAPNYNFPISNKIIQVDGPEDIKVLGMPLLVSRTEGDWNWLGQAGWNVGSDGIRFWDYGLAVSHPVGQSTQWMIEVYGFATSSFEQSTLNYQIGLDYAISPALHVLTSAGSRIRSVNEPGARLNYNFYLGLQWFP